MSSFLNIRLGKRLVLSLIVGVLGGTGCQLLLDDIEVAPRDPSTRVGPNDPTGGAGADSSAGTGGGQPPGSPGELVAGPSCIPDTQRCDGANLQRCLPSSLVQPARWVTEQDCQTAALCQVEPQFRCLAAACNAGDVECNGATPRKCNADQTDWDVLTDCPSAAHCSTSDADCGAAGGPCCQEVPCEAGELRCSSNELQACNADRTDWELQDSCLSADLCSLGQLDCTGENALEGTACICRAAACAVDETRCNGTTLERCNVGLSGWDVVEVCATEELCALGNALTIQRCEQPACDVGQFSCTEAGALQACRSDRTAFDDDEDCEGPQFCNSVGGTCEDIPCFSGEQRCNGAQRQQCRADRTGFDNVGFPCATPELCNDDDPENLRCDQPRCQVNQFACFGAQLNQCNGGRTGFDVRGQCLRADLCSTQRRRCDFCFLGRRECNVEGNASRTCAPSGDRFGPETFCPLGCIASTGACRTCQVGEFACQGNSLTRCNDGFSFGSLNRNAICDGARLLSCSNGQLQNTNCEFNGCNQFASACNDCSGTQRRCARAGFQQCDGGFFGDVQGCGGGLTCGGQGECGCDPFSLSCAGTTLQECNGTGSAFLAAARCDDEVLRVCQAGRVIEEECESDLACALSVGAVCGEDL